MTETPQKQSIESVLSANGKYVGPTVGSSMKPMLYDRRDTVVVLPKKERLKPLDVALYKRGDAYVLHRVLKVTETGYVIRGDNTYADEIVQESAVIGVLTEFFRKDKHFFVTDEKYLKYVKKRLKSFPVRLFFEKIRSKLRAIKRKIIKR